jgi:RimJ/RimL family protein N-acetyltransferase
MEPQRPLDPPGLFRRLWASDRDQLREHLLRLDGEDRQCRFGGHVSDAHIETYCTSLDWRRAVIIGYVADGAVRGIGELKPMPDAGARAAEIALSVEQPYQNAGVGTELLRRLIVIARNRAIKVLHSVCLLENGKVLRAVRKLGATLEFEQGEVEARLALPWPNHLTLLLELLDETGAVLAVLRDVRSPPAGRQRSRRSARGRRGPAERTPQARRASAG